MPICAPDDQAYICMNIYAWAKYFNMWSSYTSKWFRYPKYVMSSCNQRSWLPVPLWSPYCTLAIWPRYLSGIASGNSDDKDKALHPGRSNLVSELFQKPQTEKMQTMGLPEMQDFSHIRIIDWSFIWYLIFLHISRYRSCLLKSQFMVDKWWTSSSFSSRSSEVPDSSNEVSSFTFSHVSNSASRIPIAVSRPLMDLGFSKCFLFPKFKTNGSEYFWVMECSIHIYFLSWVRVLPSNASARFFSVSLIFSHSPSSHSTSPRKSDSFSARFNRLWVNWPNLVCSWKQWTHDTIPKVG